jgi:phage-related protein (TIGR01555 family)
MIEVKRAAQIVRQVADSWQNTLSGLGGRRDKGNVRFAQLCSPVHLDRTTLADAYRALWLVRRYINAVPEDATRRGFGEDATPDKVPRFTELNHARYAEGALIRACNLARLMGGAGVYIGYANGGAVLEQPPAPGAQVAFLEVFHRYELEAVEWSRVKDPADPRHGQPNVWRVIGQNRTGLTFHHTRMVKFPGQPRADDFETTAAVDRDWWDSILQSVWEDIVRYGMFWQGVSHLMQISSVGVLKISGLIDMLASKNQEDAEARIDLLNEALSLTRMLLLDAKHNEEYSREAVSFADVPALLQELQTATAGALNMPITKLFGRAPAGMNATGESDTTNWYDTVDSWRETVLRPRAEQLMSACEGRPVEVEFPALWEPTERECAETEQIRTNRLEALWRMGVATEAEIRTSLNEHEPIEEQLSGPPPEPEPPPQLTAGRNPDAPDDGEVASLFDSGERQDAASAQDVERRLARILVKQLRDDPDRLAEIAGPDGDIGDIRAALVSSARQMLPATSDVSGERKALVKEVKQLKTFKQEISADLPDLASKGKASHHENERRAQFALVDDPDYVKPARLPGDTTGAATYAENQKRKKAGLPLITGPRGGRYYVSVGGSKTYV